jgi:YD repeat-containing protein
MPIATLLRQFQIMTKLLLSIVAILLAACAFTTSDKYVMGSKQKKLTVISRENQDPSAGHQTDTLIKSQVIDLSKNRIDVFFCYKNFNIPYCVPTKSIYRDSIKETECNWKIYPNTVKCYEYDDKNRVIKMQVEGGGTAGSHTFKYDNQDRIIGMQGHSDIYKMTYDKEGNLLLMTVNDGALQKQLAFIYDTK